MRRYAKLSYIQPDNLCKMMNYLFNVCDKVNIYFPNVAIPEVTEFKAKFLAATHIVETSEELSALEETLEEKEGFSMIIASLTKEVKALLLGMNPHLHLDLGLISGDKVLFYLSNEGECVIESDETSDLFSSEIFNAFRKI